MGNQNTLLRRPHPAGTLGGRLRLVVLARRRLDNGLAGRRSGRLAALARLAVSSPGGHARQWRSRRFIEAGRWPDGPKRCPPAPAGRRRGRHVDSFLEGAAKLDVALEVARIEVCAPNRFVDSTKLGDRKLRRAEPGREGCVLQLGPRPLDGVPHDPLVVKRQSNRAPLDRLHWCQHCGHRVPTAPERREIGADRPVGDGDDAHARIPARRTVAGELLQVPGAVAQTRFLGQFAGRGLIQVLTRFHEATR